MFEGVMIMKSVLISIKPKWCELIANGKKTVEVRKTKPKLETPFKCYIYCTNIKPYLVWGDVFQGDWVTKFTSISGYNRKDAEEIWDVFNGKVIGEFVCDEIIEFYEETLAHDELDGNPVEAWMMWNMSDNLCEVLHLYEMEDVERCTCLTSAEILSYLHPNMNGYGWHISDLVIYDEPKGLHHFFKPCGNCDKKGTRRCTEELTDCRAKVIERPPQSWCYVEESK